MIQINASARLTAALKDAKAEAAWLKSEFGVKVGAVHSSNHGRLIFKLKVADAPSVAEAIAAKSKPQITTVQGGKIYVFEIDGRQVRVEIAKTRAYLSVSDN